MKLAILDDYQNVALKVADWNNLMEKVDITVFNDHLGSAQQVVDKLQDFEIVCINRERTRFPREVLDKLGNLRLLVTTGAGNAAIDLEAASELKITVCGTASPGHAASELAWGLIMGLSRNIVAEDRAMRRGLWQTTIGSDLRGQTLGIIGLGRHGSNVARYGQAFGMRVVAWSENLTQERCQEAGVEWVAKEKLIAESDFISIHLKMGQRYRGLVDASFLKAMKPTGFIINTSRGPIIREGALIDALKTKAIGGAGLDVYEHEPLPELHPLRELANTILTSHVGFVTWQTYEVFYRETVNAVEAWLEGSPIKVLN